MRKIGKIKKIVSHHLLFRSFRFFPISNYLYFYQECAFELLSKSVSFIINWSIISVIASKLDFRNDDSYFRSSSELLLSIFSCSWHANSSLDTFSALSSNTCSKSCTWTSPTPKLYDFLGDTRSYLVGELLGEYHKIESIKTHNIYISTYQAIIRSYTKL